MRRSKLALHVAAFCCVSVLFGTAWADQAIEVVDRPAPQQDRSETEPAEGTEAAGQDAVDPLVATKALPVPFQEFGAVVEDMIEAVDLDRSSRNPGWYTKICVPDFCQPCWSDADCFGWNRCRTGYCP